MGESQTWRIDAGEAARDVAVTRLAHGAWADPDGYLAASARIAVQAWAYRNSVMGAVLAPGEPTHGELAAQLAVLRAQLAPLLALHDAVWSAARAAGLTGAGAEPAEVVAWVLRHLGFMPAVLIVCGIVESHREDTRRLAVTAFVLAVYALGRVAYDRTLREMQEESDRRVAQDITRRLRGDNASSEEFEAWYRAVRIVDLSRVGKVMR